MISLQQLLRWSLFSFQEKDTSKRENEMENNEKTGTRAGTRANTRSETRNMTRTDPRAANAREAFWVPDICNTTTGSTYYRELIPPRPEPLHQWRDLKNRIRHDYNLVPLPYKNEDIVQRWPQMQGVGPCFVKLSFAPLSHPLSHTPVQTSLVMNEYHVVMPTIKLPTVLIFSLSLTSHVNLNSNFSSFSV